MSWFEDKNKKEKKEEEEQKPITDYDRLVATFESTMNRVQMLTNDAYSSIYPIVYDLMGNPDDPNNVGDIGRLRLALRDTRLVRTETGRIMWNTLKNIEDLNAWQGRYSQQLEQYVDALRFLMESS